MTEEGLQQVNVLNLVMSVWVFVSPQMGAKITEIFTLLESLFDL